MDKEDYVTHKRSDYADNSPYPEIKVTAPNRYYAELLMEDYAGMVSEFTAINQYLYHHFVIGNHNKDVSKLLENVAITEMLHLEMLANLIILLGGNPVYGGRYNATDKYWNATFVYYGDNMCFQLENDLESEYKAIRNYQRHIDMIQDQFIKDILKRIILDEEIHARLFKEAINKYCK